MAKTFYLNRVEDESGVSGTGRIAQGIVFDNGRVAMTWLSEHPSTTVYDSIGEVKAIHGHDGKTKVEMEPDWKRGFNELKSTLMDVSLLDVALERIPKDAEALKLLEKNVKSE